MSNNILKGVAAASGIAIGNAYIYNKHIEVVKMKLLKMLKMH